jgi:O-antigen/teichoic acid export membrane protein
MTVDISQERTRNYIFQIKGAILYKAIAMLASFLTIPMMISYLGQEQFGVWSTLLTIMSWIIFFDLGIGNGLRNKVAECFAKNERLEAGSYISSGYTMIGLISLVVWTLVTAGAYFVDWQIVFNTQAISESTLRSAIQIAILFIMLNFWIGLIGALLGAIQKTSLVAFGQLVSNLLALVLVFVLTKTTNASISNLAFVYGISLVSSNIILSVWFYGRYPELRPRLYLDKQHVRPLLTVGLQFLTIQLAAVVIFTTDKMLITQIFGPQYVTQYEVIFKLFSVITFAHGLISLPLWSAYTDAYHRNDFEWIKKMLHKQLMIFGIIILAVFLLTLTAESIIRVWIGKEQTISPLLILVMGFFVLISTWNNIYAMFVNGVGLIKLQLYTAVVAMIINIPLCVLFAKYTELGLSGIVVGSSCSLLLAGIVLPLQVHHLIKKQIKNKAT